MGEGSRALTSLVGFARALRHSGMACGPSRVRAFLDATEHVSFDDRAGLYWAGRLTLCSDPDDLPRFDAAFESWFGGSVPAARNTPRVTRPSRAAVLDAPEARGESGAEEPITALASDVEVLRRRDLADLSAEEREHIRRILATLKLEPPARPALRRARSRRGALDAGATLRQMLRTGGEPLHLPRQDRSKRSRRVVLLIDVSGSMSPYADSLLRFAHAVMRRAPASTEVFTLGTRMTRISRQLRQRDPDLAMAAASRAVPDFSGGTRLGDTLRAFLDRWGQRGTARAAIAVVFSDGWERGDTSLLAEQTRRLSRLARAVVWVNPHAGKENYAPVQSGIASALPYVDKMVAGHSVDALARLWWWVHRLAQGRQREVRIA